MLGGIGLLEQLLHINMINNQYIGGYDSLLFLEQNGELDKLL